MRSRESMDELQVRFREIVREKIGSFHPSELRDIDRAGLSIDDRAVEEMQFDGFRRIGVRRGVRLSEDFDADAEFLQKLALQRCDEGFADFDFPARKFPEIGKMRIGTPSREEDLVIAANDGCGDGDHNIEP